MFKRKVNEFMIRDILFQFVNSITHCKVLIYYKISRRGVVKLYTNRPGIIIGRNGQDINTIRDEMISKAAQDGAPSKAVKKANAVEKKYSERLKEISKLSLTDLSDEELKEISLELSDIISAIREANDLF